MFRRPFWLLLLLLTACREEKPSGTLFTLLSPSHTKVRFENNLQFDEAFNVYTYRNFYNGGGVALGDVNNDGLIDLYLTANMEPNRLFLNKGELRFEDITHEAGVAGARAWSTGVAMADVNGDGWLDIYVCNSGDIKGDNKQNELFINQGDGTFSEQAETWGLADRGYSTHAAFFDYDGDGDLDCYLLNNSYQAIGSFNLRKNIRGVRDPEGGDKLYRNDNGRFTDVSQDAGILGSVIGFGLGVTLGDVNVDGWTDIYVSNDFFERDYLYLNNGDGTFTEQLEHAFPHISAASMGADMADLNNDCAPEVFVTDMLPEGDARLKQTTMFESWDKYQYNLENGYYHQFTRNMLHLNRGDGTFSDIGLLAGVAATDWSWGALMADLDNDGWKDIFVANGIYQDLTDQDFINFLSNDQTVQMLTKGEKVNFKKLVEVIPSNPIPNYAFAGVDGYRFENKTEAWGLAQPSHSNGAAYGDLDNDGDLDLVVNNVNQPVFIYRNESKGSNYLKVELKGEAGNTSGIGARLTAYAAGHTYYIEQILSRGFQSSIDPRPNFGLGEAPLVDSLVIIWPDQRRQVLTALATNQTIQVWQKDAQTGLPAQTAAPAPVFEDITNQAALPFEHRENLYVDFNRDRMLYHMLSAEGPKMCSADVDRNGLTDFYIGGAKDQPGSLFLQLQPGKFVPVAQDVFDQDKASEDLGCTIFDANGDGYPDLYVTSGGNEFPSASEALLDRLYINKGGRRFEKSPQLLPLAKYLSTSCVSAADVDGDGDQDLFVGGRLAPWNYGVPVSSYLLTNDGKGNFSNQAADLAPGLKDLGMVTAASWSDIDGDGDPDLLVAGDWMPLKVFVNQSGRLVDQSRQAGLSQSHGWWNCIEAADLDGDGDVDFVLGNHGLNSRFRASETEPCVMHVNDFDQNGSVEQIICRVRPDGSAYPMHLRDDMVEQMPFLKKKYLNYKDYSTATLLDVFGPESLAQALKDTAFTFSTSVLWNEGEGRFRLEALPAEAQFSPVYAVQIADFTGDGMADILLGGNLSRAKPDVGRYDASYGTLLAGGKEGFLPVPRVDIRGEIRDFVILKAGAENWVLIAKNNQKMQVLKW